MDLLFPTAFDSIQPQRKIVTSFPVNFFSLFVPIFFYENPLMLLLYRKKSFLSSKPRRTQYSRSVAGFSYHHGPFFELNSADGTAARMYSQNTCCLVLDAKKVFRLNKKSYLNKSGNVDVKRVCPTSISVLRHETHSSSPKVAISGQE